MEAFQGISDALAGGDITAAARVLWAGLNVEFQKGVAAIQRPWQEWKSAFQIVAIEAFAAVQKAWINTRDWFETNFPNFTAGIAKGWAALTATISSAWETTTKFISDRMLKVMAQFDKSIDLAAALKENQRQSDTSQQQIDRDESAAVAEADRRRNRSEAERKAELAASLRDVDAESAKAIEAAATAGANKVSEAEAALEKAKAEFRDLVNQGSAKRTTQANFDASLFGVDAIQNLITKNLESVIPAVTAAAQRFGTAGTFNAGAAAQIGPASGVERGIDRAANASEQSAKTLQDILRQIRDNDGAQFE
jgi:hypothetical protein